MIREALLAAVARPRRPYKSSSTPRLWPSGLGRCPRQSMLRVLGVKAEGGFPAQLQIAMELGNRFEDSTFAYLKQVFGTAIRQSVRVKDAYWSGKIDFLLTTDSDTYIVEHKATGDKWFDYEQGLPKDEHVCQACLYRHLYQQQFNVDPKVLLFYRSWSSWAEFALTEEEEGVRCKGQVNDLEVSRWKWVRPTEKRLALEGYLSDGVLPPVPDKPSAEQGCLFRGKPTCSYYSVCFPEGGHHR